MMKINSLIIKCIFNAIVVKKFLYFKYLIIVGEDIF